LLLKFDPKQGRVEFRLIKGRTLLHPTGPELAGFSQPSGFGEASGDGGLEHGVNGSGEEQRKSVAQPVQIAPTLDFTAGAALAWRWSHGLGVSGAAGKVPAWP
jgi:hypothetical protein